MDIKSECAVFTAEIEGRNLVLRVISESGRHELIKSIPALVGELVDCSKLWAEKGIGVSEFFTIEDESAIYLKATCQVRGGNQFRFLVDKVLPNDDVRVVSTEWKDIEQQEEGECYGSGRPGLPLSGREMHL